MNPARTFGSAFYASYWHALWIYFIAPALGMLAGAELFLRTRGGAPPYCAKLHHANDKRCIFQHGYEMATIGIDSVQLCAMSPKKQDERQAGHRYMASPMEKEIQNPNASDQGNECLLVEHDLSSDQSPERSNHP